MSTSATASGGRTAAQHRVPLVRWIHLDAVMSGTSGVLLAAGAPLLDDVLGAPAAFLVPLGIFLLAYAGALVLLARDGAPAPGVVAVIAGNGLWAIASVVAVVADWLTLTTAGTVLTLVHAGAVALLADVQLVSLRRSRRSID